MTRRPHSDPQVHVHGDKGRETRWSDHPASGEPHGEFWFAQGTLIHGRDRGGIDIGPLIGEARTEASARSLVEEHNSMVCEASATAPLDVERRPCCAEHGTSLDDLIEKARDWRNSDAWIGAMFRARLFRLTAEGEEK